MNSSKAWAHLLIGTLVAGILLALLLAPVAGIAGAAVKQTNRSIEDELAGMTAGRAPGVTTIRDATGEPMVYLYRQHRQVVPADKISQAMKDAIVAIEDHRFYEHTGVDLRGTARALVTNVLAGGVSQGASTLNQQYVKNYLLHVAADTEEEQQAAVEQSIPRKLREMRLASELDRRLSKDQILANYLNLVPFGNHAYGIEVAAQTYFDIPAAELSVPQAAMLAGMVQSSEYLNPYTNEEAVIERRNTVLQSMVDNGVLAQADATAFAAEPLGVREDPPVLPNGCITAGNRGFFCDYVINYLEAKGLTEEQIYDDALDVTTTLDPALQDAAHSTAATYVASTQPGVAEVINVVEPTDERGILAMTSSRDYGLDVEAGQTYLPQPSTLIGNGAGSVFKVFTAAAALEDGMGLNETLPVPARYNAQGLGNGGAAGCPPGMYCVENAGVYKPSMTLTEALAHSPNTTFIILTERVGVPAIVDMAVKLGLRSYTEPGTYDENTSIADYFKDNNLGSFTLGPTAVNPLELSNVGATLGADGRWCEPNPVRKVTNRQGQELALERPDCEQVLDAELARALGQAMTLDVAQGTAREAAQMTGFSGSAAAKTGTTESHMSAAFLGFNSTFAAAPYIFNDGPTTTPLCTSPVYQCDWGSLFGGDEPARSYFTLHMQSPLAMQGYMPQAASTYFMGTTNAALAGVSGLSEDVARARLAEAGLTVTQTTTVFGNGLPRGVVVSAIALGGGAVQLQLADGSPAAPIVEETPTSGTSTAPTTAPNGQPGASLDDTVSQLQDFADEVNGLLGDLVG
ncbi:penicillin-binding protein [Corynebacterium uterequi]|uniref:penicillin-binding protein n=1 Tax=Corynebacterium uterequi TaxID=1072256 RepID=UPI00069B3D4B|nr:penicillin-binding protein [Corynebacterium uterequi]